MSADILATVKELVPNVELTMISQGAEALVFTAANYTNYKNEIIETGETCVMKYRPKKRYRHPQLDKSITKSRTRGEAKVMEKLKDSGINVPRLLYVDVNRGIIWMSYIGYILDNGNTSSLKNWLWLQENKGTPLDSTVFQVLNEVGKAIGQMHLKGIVHGDLTSSNIIVMESKEVGLIDFGLSVQRAPIEDKAVDLYVLERALSSTHSKYSEKYNELVLEGYLQAHSGSEQLKEWKAVETRLIDVRQRGRKRSMLG